MYDVFKDYFQLSCSCENVERKIQKLFQKIKSSENCVQRVMEKLK